MNIKFENMIAQAALEEFPLDFECNVYIANNPIFGKRTMSYITIFSDEIRNKMIDEIFPYLPKSAYDRFMKLYGFLIEKIMENATKTIEEDIDPYSYDTEEELKEDVKEYIMLEAEHAIENELFYGFENLFRVLGIFHNRIQTVKGIKEDLKIIQNCELDIYSIKTNFGTSFYIQNPKTLLKDQED